MQSFNRKTPSAYLSINLIAVEKNLNSLQKKVKNVMPMVKANAYGTDAFELAKFFQAQSVSIIGVSHINEAISLREKGITLPIFVINVPSFDATLAVKFDLDAAISNLEEAQALSQAARNEKKIARVHISINTGMNRFGVPHEKALEFVHLVSSLPYLQLEGIMTHFACSDRADLDSFTQKQITLFENIINKLQTKPRWIHAANSSGAIRFDLPFCNLARVGLGLLGYGKDLTPSLTLESHLVSISSANKEECVGYNCQYKIQKDNFRIGVVPVGYHDGLHRKYSEKGYVLIRGKKAPMIGTICMDFMMVDLSEIPEASIFDPVVLFNCNDLPPEMVASWADTDVRELLSCLGPRIRRLFIKKPILKTNEEYERYRERLSGAFDPFQKDSTSGKHFTSS